MSSMRATPSSSIVNELRFGLRRTQSGNTQPCDLPELQDEVFAYLPKVNGYPVIPHPVNFSNHKLQAGCNGTSNFSPMSIYADSAFGYPEPRRPL